MKHAFLNHTIPNYDALFKERFQLFPLTINYETRDYSLVASSKMGSQGPTILIYRNEQERHTVKIQVDQDGRVEKAFVYYENTCEKGILH